MERRGVYSAQQVCAVQDGTDCIQGFVDLHRPDAVRILDFAHASGYLTEIAELVKAAGTPLREDWLQTHLHALKHQGPSTVLKEAGSLLEKHPQGPELQTKVNYLRKREQQMQYPRYQQQGWPIGSGSVESANKGVVQARRVWGRHTLGTLARQSDALFTYRCLPRSLEGGLAVGLSAASKAWATAPFLASEDPLGGGCTEAAGAHPALGALSFPS
jgi:hypothetical protein